MSKQKALCNHCLPPTLGPGMVGVTNPIFDSSFWDPKTTRVAQLLAMDVQGGHADTL